MIIKASHHPVVYPFIRFYTKWKIARSFSSVEISGNFVEKGLPLLIIANHVSWWDGFWVLYLNMKIFRRKFHFMMLEEQLKKYSFFNKSGGFSIKKGSRSMLETIDYTAEILNNPENTVLLFPQGKIQSIYQSSFQFGRGTEKVLKKTNHEIQIIFIVNMIDYFSCPKPGLFIYFKEFRNGNTEIETIEQEYNRFYDLCRDEQQKKSE